MKTYFIDNSSLMRSNEGIQSLGVEEAKCENICYIRDLMIWVIWGVVSYKIAGKTLNTIQYARRTLESSMNKQFECTLFRHLGI